MSAGVIGKDSETESEIQAAKIIVDALGSWNDNLATELSVIDSAENCPDGWKPAFYSEWPGIIDGCYYDGRYITRREYNAKNKRDRKKGCEPLNKVNSINQTIFAGKKICKNSDG